MAQTLYNKIVQYINSIDREYIAKSWEKELIPFGQYLSQHVVMAPEVREEIGKMLFYYDQDHPYYGIKAGQHLEVQCFSLVFKDECSKYLIRFYLCHTQNWEEYQFLIDERGEIADYRLATNFEYRVSPDFNRLTQLIEDTIDLHLNILKQE